MLSGVQMEHEVDQRTREPSASADQHRKACARDLGAALEVDNPEGGAKVPVRLWCKAERSRRAVPTHLDVVGTALPDRHRLVRQIRKHLQAAIPALLDGIEFDTELLDLLRAQAAGVLNLRRVEALALRTRDFVGRRVLFSLEALEFLQQATTTRLECRELFEFRRQVDAACAQSRAHGVEVVTEQCRIEHAADCTCDTIAHMTRSVRKAVFPAAGLGTRFLPATKAQPKEMLVVVDKPVIQYGVEEAVQSGVTNIVIVTGRGKNAIEDHFDVAVELETFLEQRGKQEQLEEIRKITKLINVSYVRQGEPLGLGHAVLVTRNLVGDEPFAVVLGDDVIDATPPALRQMIDVFERLDGPVIAVERVPHSDVSSYGIVAIDERADLGPGVHRITDMVEKPPRDEAPSNLAIIGRYILTPDIFPALEATASDRTGEIQLTNGLRRLLQERPIYACEIAGVRHDTGNKLGFLKAVVYFALQRPELAEPFRRYLETLDLKVGAQSGR